MGLVCRLAFIGLVAFFFFNCSLIVDGKKNGGDTGPPVVERIAIEVPCVPVGAETVFSVVATGAPIDGYDWDFGDGTGSDVPEPAHTYGAVGNYQVSVTVTNSEGSDTFAMPTPLRAITPGWSLFLPSTGLGDLAELWQNPNNAGDALALGELGRLWGWDGANWHDRRIQLARPQAMHAVNGNAAMIIDRNPDNTYGVYKMGEGGLVDADPMDELPNGTSDAYQFVYMTSPTDGIMLVRPSLGGIVEIWRYDGTGGGADDYWTLVPTVGAPNVAGSQFAAAGATDSENIFVSNGSTIYHWNNINDWDGPSLPSGNTPTAMVALNMVQVVYGTSDGELRLATFNSSVPSWSDILAFDNSAWTADYSFRDISVTADGNAVYAVAIDSRSDPEPDMQIVVRVTNLGDPTPAVELVDIATLHYGGYDAQIAAFSHSQVWHGGAMGAISGWDGSAWALMTPEPLTADDVGFPGFAPSGRLFISNVDGRPNKMLSHFRGEWNSWELPELAQPFVTYASAADDAWALGSDPTAYHLEGDGWVPVPVDMGLSGRFEFIGMWGSSATDIWAVGGDNDTDTALVLRYQGEAWERDTQGEEALRFPAFTVDGSGSNDVYAGTMGGVLMHFDGTTWAPVVHGLFTTPNYVNVCLDDATRETDCDALTGTVFSPIMSVVDSGAVFASIKETTHRFYSITSDGDYGCLMGQYICVSASGDDFRGQSPVYFNGTAWVTQTLPAIPDSTDVGIIWLWAASESRAYAAIAYENTISGDYELRVATWDGASWTLLADQPQLPPDEAFAALHGFQAGEIYLQLLDSGNQMYRYLSCEE